jgi:hypothetical protein
MADLIIEGANGSFLGFAEVSFDLGKALLD